ncbi:MAG: PD-(D/E)XK nuclease family protein [Pirellulales bacterium]|nr:PD-(D/E)XK nuclease family protein [Pirellulales bacterium]
MSIERVFLGWDRPALSLAVDYLVERFAAGESLDLSKVIVAVPGGRAGRRLLERLVEWAETNGQPLFPPRIITVGRLPELLYTAKRPFADPLTQQLAWVEALRRAGSETLDQLTAQLPDDEDLAAWLALGEMLGRLHRELASEKMNFQTVVDCGSRIRGFQEQARWTALARLQGDYLAVLDRLGLWDVQSARLYAVDQGECRVDQTIVLAGTVDLNRLQRMMLDQVAEQTTALVFAPESMAERFDDLGCLRPEAWQELPSPLDDEQIEVVDTAAQQAEAVLRAIASLGGRRAADEITVGVPDERIVPHLLQQFRQCELSARHGVGEPLSRSGPYRLLAAAADYLEGPRFASLAALARHPAVGQWIERQGIVGDWLTELDCYRADHLPHRIDGNWLGTIDKTGVLHTVHEAVEQLLRPLGGARQPLAAWSPAIVDLLVAVHGGGPLRPDDPAEREILSACEKIRAVLDEHRAVDASLAPEVNGADAVRLVLRAVASETIAAPAEPGSVELLGWLELALDDAPVLIVTGMNEGIVPASLDADLFLPNQIRRALGIEDNLRRCARDAYALGLLAASGRRLKLIAGRRSPEGDPLLPSRLLLSGDVETTARRVRRLFDGGDAGRVRAILPGRLVAGQTDSAFDVPRPLERDERLESMRVTEFRDYLACPYRYYLRHRLRLAGLADRAEELDGAAFGSLAHEVLGQFGASAVAESTDAAEIGAFLDAAFARVLGHIYGSWPLASIRIQAEQLRLRLAQFARWQADRAERGWRIEHVEEGPSPDVAILDVDGEPIGLRGRIDRIDVNGATGERIILDYKTSDTAKTPEQTHREKRSRWIDLQLPLYRHLARGLGIEGPVALGYIALPKDVAKVGLLRAEWSAEELENADETARQVVRDIRAGKFWPPTDPPPPFAEEFSAICQDGQFGSWLGGDDGEEEEAP